MSVHADDWHQPPTPLALDDKEVHVWRARLDVPAPRLRQYEELLSEDEMARARKFRFPVHRDRFVSRRAVLRCLLGGYLQVSPADVTLEHTGFGKPVLALHHDTDLRFNLSVSEDLALYAITRGRDVGVDLEHIKPAVSDESVPEQFFASHEVAVLRAIPKAHQPAAFFDCWVRKEAYIKARGMGLSLALDSFEVSFGDAGPARLLRTAPDPEDAGRWTMVALYPAPSHAAALVVAGQAWTLRRWNWSWMAGEDNHLLG